MIYHMLPKAEYDGLDDTTPYAAASLATEGFIHCTADPDRLVGIANRFYRDTPGPFVLMCIREQRIRSSLRWEEADGHVFPHIYGTLNWDAVDRVIDFPRHQNGDFILPPGLE